MVDGTDASANWAGAAPGTLAPAKRSPKVDDGRKDRVGGAGDVDENRLLNEEGTDAVVPGVPDDLSVAQRDANVADPETPDPETADPETPCTRRRASTSGRLPPSIIPAHRLNANVSPASPAATDATPTRIKSARPRFPMRRTPRAPRPQITAP